MPIRLQREPFDASAELAAYRPERSDLGAEVHFVGTMRDLNQGDGVVAMELEHYPGMTDGELDRLLREAGSRWELLDALIVHRFGEINPGEPIVLVSTWSRHRDEAFDACRFLIDALKTCTPFWKKERLQDGETRWVEPHAGEGQPRLDLV